MNIYNKVCRLFAKKLRLLSTVIEPKCIYDEFANLKVNYADVSQTTSSMTLIENGNPIILRKGTSDAMVFQQIFIDKEYSDLVDMILLNKKSITTILDLGANIGLTTIYLIKYFPNATYLCVEPDKKNFELMQLNLTRFSNIVLYQKAIWSNNNNLYLNRNFRDGKDWSISVSNDDLGAYTKVETITIDNILEYNHLSIIDLVKIDIEGAEAEIFKSEAHLDFLDKTRIIAIEIHEEFISREVIISQLMKHKFLLIETKQTLIAINLNLF